MSTKTLMQQNIELRRKLEEEHAGYKRKLQAYQDGQHRQAQLVQKLQAKVWRMEGKQGILEVCVCVRECVDKRWGRGGAVQTGEHHERGRRVGQDEILCN